MNMSRYLLLLLPLLLFLTSCNDAQKPRHVESQAAAPTVADFGELRVHYNLIPTISMSPQMRAAYGIETNPNSALLIIALRRLVEEQETPLEGEVSVNASNLAGTQQNPRVNTITTEDYKDYYAVLRADQRDTLNINISVQSNGQQETIKFTRNF